MTLTLDLTLEEERRILNAKRKGFDAITMFRAILATLPDESNITENGNLSNKPVAYVPKAENLSELFAQWAVKDALMTQEQKTKEDADWAKIMENLR